MSSSTIGPDGYCLKSDLLPEECAHCRAASGVDTSGPTIRGMEEALSVSQMPTGKARMTIEVKMVGGKMVPDGRIEIWVGPEEAFLRGELGKGRPGIENR